MQSSTPHFIDAHTHVQFAAYDADREEVIARATAGGVSMVVIGTQRDTSARAVALAEAHAAEGMYAAIGLHPIHTSRSFHDADELGGMAGGDAVKPFVSRGEVFDYEYYKALAENPRTVAIGECGLDYFRFNEDEPRDGQIARQKDAFAAQMRLTKDVAKPLMIHCREAFADTIAMLRAAGPDGFTPGIVHFFTGTVDDARALLDMGFSFTFGGAVTFPPRKGAGAGTYDEVVKFIPIDRIMSETDAPYVAPAPFRGTRNEPSYIPHIVAKLAELKGVSPEEMKARILANAERVFGIEGFG
ncbi:MAG: TatD family hydrolase [Candidatus Pacebacteria bacterium]|nr:TatD family hydrolase [Candidatus Paceibacterota bacterium]